MAFYAPRRSLGKLKRVLLSVLPNCVCPLKFSGSREPPTLLNNSIGIHRYEFRPENCSVGPAFLTVCSVFLQIGSIRDPFQRKRPLLPPPGDCTGRPGNSGNKRPPQSPRGSLGYPRPSTLPQNSIGSLRGDVRPDLCQSGLSSIPAGSIWCHSGLFNGKQPKPDPSTVQPDS
ncbi:hypothetical protein CRG98_009939 [Punica granatum]|uniref:Uncharacterized protein n=1 Tax=Punica granatum TaxID=22663 RepID=A0A2I0KMG1_PUNGR|nr:hypothetical protein CRG98_009939 [Punica granatum]